MSRVIDRDEHGQPVGERYQRLGASGTTEIGPYVRFEPGFGLNVHIGIRRATYYDGAMRYRSGYVDDEKLVLGIEGWERLCELADEWRERKRVLDAGGAT